MSPIYVPGKVVLAKQFTWNETIWNPSMIQTALWLDAADASTVTTVSGTVSQWNDKSGNSRHVSQSGASSRPAYTASAINGLPALTFISDDFLERSSPGLVTGASSRSMFAVYKPNTTGNNANWVCGQAWNGTTTNSWFGLMHRNDVVKGDPYLATYAGDITDGATPATVAKIGGATYDGTTLVAYRNGTEIASGARTLATNTGVSFLIGRDGQASSYMNGQAAEVVFIESALSTLNRQKIEGYLAHKWGLTANLPNDHPYKLVGPTP